MKIRLRSPENDPRNHASAIAFETTPFLSLRVHIHSKTPWQTRPANRTRLVILPLPDLRMSLRSTDPRVGSRQASLAAGALGTSENGISTLPGLGPMIPYGVRWDRALVVVVGCILPLMIHSSEALGVRDKDMILVNPPVLAMIRPGRLDLLLVVAVDLVEAVSADLEVASAATSSDALQSKTKVAIEIDGL